MIALEPYGRALDVSSCGVTGLGLGFLVGHPTGNMHMLQGAERMNEYADFLHHIPMFGLIEPRPMACFVGHIGLALSLAPANRGARRHALRGIGHERVDGGSGGCRAGGAQRPHHPCLPRRAHLRFRIPRHAIEHGPRAASGTSSWTSSR